MKLNNAIAAFLFTVVAGPMLVSAASAATQLTREEVRAEVVRARAAGELDVTEANYPPEFKSPTSTLTRAQVRAELLRARAAGELDLTEASYPFSYTQEKSTVTRAAVLAEVIRARNAGELDITEATPATWNARN
jgi:hypothetical protein